jgi:hypothetical protein
MCRATAKTRFHARLNLLPIIYREHKWPCVRNRKQESERFMHKVVSLTDRIWASPLLESTLVGIDRRLFC